MISVAPEAELSAPVLSVVLAATATVPALIAAAPTVEVPLENVRAFAPVFVSVIPAPFTVPVNVRLPVPPIVVALARVIAPLHVAEPAAELVNAPAPMPAPLSDRAFAAANVKPFRSS